MKDNFSWENFISQETAKDYFKGIKFKLISDHKEGHKIFPNPKSFLELFSYVPSKNQSGYIRSGSLSH
ncbi:MAG: hypothetical protein CM15mP127_14850 [Gammaproteobacteria bacterium]|nr:MAG: hypothetical protein CM15mP127_14850 [Gammaproteobacteria bacterium]